MMQVHGRRPPGTCGPTCCFAVFLGERCRLPTLTDHAVGDLVVLGHDGVARIDDITEVSVNGTSATMLKLTVLSARMSVTIPLERAQQRGLRRVADPTEAPTALERLQTEAGMELVPGSPGTSSSSASVSALAAATSTASSTCSRPWSTPTRAAR